MQVYRSDIQIILFLTTCLFEIIAYLFLDLFVSSGVLFLSSCAVFFYLLCEVNFPVASYWLAET